MFKSLKNRLRHRREARLSEARIILMDVREEAKNAGLDLRIMEDTPKKGTLLADLVPCGLGLGCAVYSRMMRGFPSPRKVRAFADELRNEIGFRYAVMNDWDYEEYADYEEYIENEDY